MAVFSVILNTPAVAHSAAGGIEVGTIFGISRYRDDDGLTTSVGLPGSAYISGFLIEKLSLGAEFTYAKMSFEEDASWWEEDESLTLYAVAVGPRVTFYPYGHSMSGPYFMGQGVFSRFSFTEDETSEAYNNFGAGPRPRLSVEVEASPCAASGGEVQAMVQARRRQSDVLQPRTRCPRLRAQVLPLALIRKVPPHLDPPAAVQADVMAAHATPLSRVRSPQSGIRPPRGAGVVPGRVS